MPTYGSKYSDVNKQTSKRLLFARKCGDSGTNENNVINNIGNTNAMRGVSL